ncbi:DUF4003 family protein [Dethiothermospora halolimnae]|uniref:DUF4003 family protein n=1 Tax=Dethiothermospora halolimnae TaxID=3114390 RepID=UPI003CCB813C
MLNQSLEKRFNDQLNIYNQLYEKLKWKLQKEIIAMVASVYIINDKEFDLDELIDVSNYIKDNVGLFSPLRSHQKYAMAAMLISKFENPKGKFDELINYYDKLVEGGFKKGTYTSIAALALMTTVNDNENIESRIEKSLEVYKGMKSNHFFLTSQGDYPLAVLLSKFDKSNDILMEEVERFYKDLSESNFKKGNDLQLLSHILMLGKDEHNEDLVNRCNRIYDEMIDKEIKIKRRSYPQIGLIALINSEVSTEIQNIKELLTKLNNQKGFKYMKDINLMVSTGVVVKSKIKDKEIIETGLSTTIETIIQAQNAAMIGAIAASSAAATASS